MSCRRINQTTLVLRYTAQATFVWTLILGVMLAVPRVPVPAASGSGAVIAAVEAVPGESLAAVEFFSLDDELLAESDEAGESSGEELPEEELPDALPVSVPRTNESERSSAPSEEEQRSETEVLGYHRRTSSLPRANFSRHVVERPIAALARVARSSFEAVWLDHSLASQRGISANLRC